MADLNKNEETTKDEVGSGYTQAAPASLSVAEVNRRNRKYWEQPGGETFKNHGYKEKD